MGTDKVPDLDTGMDLYLVMGMVMGMGMGMGIRNYAHMPIVLIFPLSVRLFRSMETDIDNYGKLFY